MAALVTITAFAVTTWVCGALVLPHVMKDSGVRWGVAGALGVAVAALAALWGHSFGVTAQSAETTSRSVPGAESKITTAGSEDTHNKISGGTFHGPVVQGRDISESPSGGFVPPASPKSEDQ